MSNTAAGFVDRAKYFRPLGAVLAAGTYVGEEHYVPRGAQALAVESKFDYGSSGTTCKVYVQTTLDGGLTWIDIMCHAFTTSDLNKVSAVRLDVALAAGVTPGDGALADNTILDGLIGDRVRAKVVIVGAYAATTLVVSGVFR